jgi:hypothetical protein
MSAAQQYEAQSPIKALTEWQVRHFEWQRLVRDMEHVDLDPPRIQSEHVGKTKALARTLYDFTGPDGTCNPGIDRLAYEINMGRTATKERLERLKKLGLVRVVKSGKGRGKGNTWALTFPEKTVGSSSRKRSELPSENGRRSDQEVVQEVVVPLSPYGERGLVVEDEEESSRLSTLEDDLQPVEHNGTTFVAPNGAPQVLDPATVKGRLRFIADDLELPPLPWSGSEFSELVEADCDEGMLRERGLVEGAVALESAA